MTTKNDMLQKINAVADPAVRAAQLELFEGLTGDSVLDGFTEKTNPFKNVTAETNPVTGGIIKTIWNGSQAQYDAIAVKDDSTLYVIV